MVGMLHGEMATRRRNGRLLRTFEHLVSDWVVGRRNRTARELRKVSAERPTATRAFGEHVSYARIGFVARAHDLNSRKPTFAITFHHHDVVAGHATHDIGALNFAFDGFHACHLARSRNHRLACASGTMAIRILSGDVDIEAHVAVVLHTTYVEASSHQFSDKLFDQRCLARIMASNYGHRRTRNVHHTLPPFIRRSV